MALLCSNWLCVDDVCICFCAAGVYGLGILWSAGDAPEDEAEAHQWYSWAAYIRTGGVSGRPPPPRIMKLHRMWEDVICAPNESEHLRAWHRLADQMARDLPVIGIMTSPGKLVYVRKNFRNVPKLALADWIAHDPGNCCPESFFFSDSLYSESQSADKNR